MTTETAEQIRLRHRAGSPIWTRKRQAAEARAEEERAREEDRVRRRLPNPFTPAPLTDEQRAARRERADYAVSLRAWRGDIATGIQEADAAMNNAVAMLDLEVWTAAHQRHAALVSLAARLDNQARMAARIPPLLPGGGRR